MFYDCPVDISYQKLIKGTEEKLNNFIIEILEKKKKKQKKNDERPWMPAPWPYLESFQEYEVPLSLAVRQIL